MTVFRLNSASKTSVGCESFLANVNSRSHSQFAVTHPSVCLFVVCLSSVMFVRPTRAVQVFSNISTALGTLAIR